jgi:hypothetical protein
MRISQAEGDTLRVLQEDEDVGPLLICLSSRGKYTVLVEGEKGDKVRAHRVRVCVWG